MSMSCRSEDFVIRSAYDGLVIDTALVCSEPSRTKQSEAAACDVNLIVSRWLKSGCAMDLSQRVGQFFDTAEIPSDYHACQNFIVQAQGLFQALPSAVRERFQNDPARFVDFAQNPENLDEMVRMGLAVRKSPVEPAGSSDSPLAGATGEAAAAASSGSGSAP